MVIPLNWVESLGEDEGNGEGNTDQALIHDVLEVQQFAGEWQEIEEVNNLGQGLKDTEGHLQGRLVFKQNQNAHIDQTPEEIDGCIELRHHFIHF
jgi:hypothetical protein